MAFRDLLVTVDPSDAGNARMELALKLAKRHHARLLGYYVYPAPRPAPIAAGLRGAIGGAGETSHEGDIAAAMEQRFNEGLELGGVEGAWLLGSADPVPELRAQLRCCDLAILGQIDPERPVAEQQRFRPEELVLGSGRPALVVPYIGASELPGGRVVVCWDGSSPASRATHDALPLLVPARQVTVLTVAGGERAGEEAAASAEVMVAHLRRHGVHVEAELTPPGELAVADVILSRASDLGADLLVAGLYGHSRLRESILGGASRGLLGRMTVPVLMAH
jgi:nucleotide-binding universal stress UspA family protein